MLSATLKRLALEAGDAGIDVRDGRRVVQWADRVIAIRLEWLRSHGLAHVIQSDGALKLDSAGEYRYAHRAEMPDGSHLYERVETSSMVEV